MTKWFIRTTSKQHVKYLTIDGQWITRKQAQKDSLKTLKTFDLYRDAEAFVMASKTKITTTNGVIH